MKPAKVFVALSGGVDSACAAALLVHAGHEVTGVFLREYDIDLTLPLADKIKCSQTGDRASALTVAAHLGIPFEEWDFRRQYQKWVVDYFVREYRDGRTPNPDILCNQKIKFGLFIDKALRQGAYMIATGHYAQIGTKSKVLGDMVEENKDTKTIFRLLKAVDAKKDQTYFLYTLAQEQLRHTLFPIGGYTKSHVRKLAKKFGLPNWDRKDSQGVCFIGKLPMKDFLKSKVKPKNGPLRTLDGEDIGIHEGACYYTIGQRHGIGFRGGKEPYYVVDKDIRKNIVYVAHGTDKKALYKKNAQCADVHWISGSAPHFPLRCEARARYRQPLSLVSVKKEYAIVFARPQRAVAPGQAIVFYKGQECLGGGILL